MPKSKYSQKQALDKLDALVRQIYKAQQPIAAGNRKDASEQLHECRALCKQLADFIQSPADRRRNTEWVYAAQGLFHDEGTLEVDDGAVVSCDNQTDGAYVEMWGWVPRDELDASKRPDPGFPTKTDS